MTMQRKFGVVWSVQVEKNTIGSDAILYDILRKEILMLSM